MRRERRGCGGREEGGRERRGWEGEKRVGGREEGGRERRGWEGEKRVRREGAGRCRCRQRYSLFVAERNVIPVETYWDNTPTHDLDHSCLFLHTSVGKDCPVLCIHWKTWNYREMERRNSHHRLSELKHMEYLWKKKSCKSFLFDFVDLVNLVLSEECLILNLLTLKGAMWVFYCLEAKNFG